MALLRAQVRRRTRGERGEGDEKTERANNWPRVGDGWTACLSLLPFKLRLPCKDKRSYEETKLSIESDTI